MEIVLIIAALAIVVLFFVLKKKSAEKPPEEAKARQPEALREKERKSTAPSSREEPEEAPREKEEAPPSDERAEGEAEQAPPAPAEEERPAEETRAEAAGEEAVESLPPEDTVGSPPPPPARDATGAEAVRKAELLSLRKGLARSRESEGFFGRLKGLLGGKRDLDPAIAEEIEEILLTSDVGVATTEKILDQIKEGLSKGDLANEEKVFEALKEHALQTLSVEGPKGGLDLGGSPSVVLFVGVNGAGKTTTIGKLAKQLSARGKKVMLAAGDTFRAAAVDQLEAWGERVDCKVISGKEGADPSSVLFEAIQTARQSGADVLLADTAGRLHTKTNLMQEMSKVQRTAAKALDGAPHETLLVIDATNGQNAMAQAREFKEALSLTGLVLTKLDGTARGGVVLGICDALQLPVRYVGVGERPEDLHEFDAKAFVEALLGSENEEIAA